MRRASRGCPRSPAMEKQQLHSVEASDHAQGFLSPVRSVCTRPSWPAILRSRKSHGGGGIGSVVLVHKVWEDLAGCKVISGLSSEISTEKRAPLGKENHSE